MQLDDHLIWTYVDPLDQDEKDEPHAQRRHISPLFGEFGGRAIRLCCSIGSLAWAVRISNRLAGSAWPAKAGSERLKSDVGDRLIVVQWP